MCARFHSGRGELDGGGGTKAGVKPMGSSPACLRQTIKSFLFTHFCVFFFFFLGGRGAWTFLSFPLWYSSSQVAQRVLGLCQKTLQADWKALWWYKLSQCRPHSLTECLLRQLSERSSLPLFYRQGTQTLRSYVICLRLRSKAKP